MSQRTRPFTAALVVLVLLLSQAIGFSAGASAASPATRIQHLQFHGTFNPAAQGGGSTTLSTARNLPAPDVEKDRKHGAAAPAAVPWTPGADIVNRGELPGFTGFNGLSHTDQLLAGTGDYANSQFATEPPDQGLCVGNGYLVEVVNTALQMFTTSGAPLTPPIALNQFMNLPPEVTDTTPPVYGSFLADPRCYYDPDTDRWFLTVLELDLDPVTGDFGSHSMVIVSVSQSGDPTEPWDFYTLETTDDGSHGTPSDPGCPCLPDQPLIGADANGFYVTANEFSIEGDQFNGSQVYAFSKLGLEDGSNTDAVHIDAAELLLPYGEPAYSIQPATSPAGNYETANNGTEYFMSSTDFDSTSATSLAVWALTNTASLNTADMQLADVSLSAVVIPSEFYAMPPAAKQQPGPYPLGQGRFSRQVKGPLELLDSGDDRLQQVVYADGRLWAGLTTAIKAARGATTAGIAYFVVTPSDPSGTLSARMTAQGYLGAQGQSLIYPSIGVTDTGQAVIAFTLVGLDYHPSAAYAPLSLSGGAGPIYIAAAGVAPEDGFTGYRYFDGNGVARWGDYTAAVADAQGTIWMGAEYIPGGPRSPYANWGTFIYSVTP